MAAETYSEHNYPVLPNEQATQRGRPPQQIERISVPIPGGKTLLLTQDQETVFAPLLAAYTGRTGSVQVDNLAVPFRERGLPDEQAIRKVYRIIMELRRTLPNEVPELSIESFNPQKTRNEGKTGRYYLRQRNPYGNRTRPQDLEKYLASKLSPKTPKTMFPEYYIAFNSSSKVLTCVLEGRLKEEDPNLNMLLTNGLRDSPYSESDFTLVQILNDSSSKRLQRFFKTTFIAILEEGFARETAGKAKTKEEALTSQQCKELETKNYDIKRVVQEVFTHFRIEIPKEYL